MEAKNNNISESELVSENEVISKKKQNRRKATKPPVSQPKAPRKPRKRDPCWDFFTKSEDDPDFALCNHSNTAIGCSTANGTSAMNNHMASCRMYPPNIDKKQKLIDLESRTRTSEDGSFETFIVPKLWEFNEELIRRALVKMLILDELSFSFVEKEGFRAFCKAMNSHFHVPSRATVTRDCYKMFIEERRELVNMFKKLSSRVSLTTDTWTSGQNLCYMCLTAHFIDDNWVLHKKIINFCPIASHSGILIGRAVEKCLLEWGLKNILTITADNASSNDVAIEHLRKVFNHWECGVLNGSFLHMRCAAHVLNLVVKDGLSTLTNPVKKVRTLVRYVRSSPSRLLKFEGCVKEEKIESKSSVCLDVETRWNSTYLMLQSAVKFKKAFYNLILKDASCEKESKKCEGGLINDSNWDEVNGLLPFLKIFYEATLRFSSSRYVTSNTYLLEIFGISTVIKKLITNLDELVRSMALKMQTKYQKYWGDIMKLNQFLFMVVVLDPRRKWQYITFFVREGFEGLDLGTTRHYY